MDVEQSTKERLISAAIDCLESTGERSIKLMSIAKSVGVSEPAIYAHFKNRKELVTAAYAEWYWRSLVTPMSPTESTDEAVDIDDYLARLRAYIRSSFTADRVKARAARVTVIGAAQRDPELQKAVNKANRQFMSLVERAVRTAQIRGWCRRDLDAKAIAYWINGMMTGRILAEMDSDSIDLAAWDNVAEALILALLPADH